MADKLLGKKVKVTLDDVKHLIVAEVLKGINSKRTGKVLQALTLYFEGTMGIGKSQAVQQAVKLLSAITGEDFGLIDIRLAGMTGSDIQGIPVPVDMNGEKFLKWLKDTLLPGIAKDCPKYGILFLDELNQVEDNSVKSLLYQLILDRKINDYTVPEGWFIFAAGNREEDGGVYNRLPAPVRDRMMIVEVELNPQQWLDYYARPFYVHNSVISFIENNESYLHTYDPEKENDGDEECENYVFATPRSWVMVSDELYAFEDTSNINTYVTYDNYGQLISERTLEFQICGLLGEALGKKFFQFYLQTRDCNIEEICSINWRGGNPSKNISLTPEQLVYLTTVAQYPTEANLERSMRIVLYVASRGSTTTGVNLVLNSYTEDQLKRLYDFCIENGCANILTTMENCSAKFKEIRASQM